MNAITVRSRKELEGPRLSMREEMREVKEEDIVGKEVSVEPPNEKLDARKLKEVQAKIGAYSMNPYKPPIPYPERLAKAKEEQKYGKFLEMLKFFYINLPFVEAVTDMPSYAKIPKGFSLQQMEAT